MDVETASPSAEVETMSRLTPFQPLPEVDHLVSEGSLRLAIRTAVAERSRYGDFEGIGAEMSVAAAHPATEAEWYGR